ncbi:hypothetical protein [Albidovulum sp.]|uniref:hypothetical protein n=1 Tax=Albidovulum sp. TaxID=1872424 RepID=UPI0035283FC8
MAQKDTEAVIDIAEDDRDEATGSGDTGFRRNTGQRYASFLDGLHEKVGFDWYMEIGCRAGRTFAPVRANTIAVDPFFKAEHNIIGDKRRLFVFQETSDDFFASGFLDQMQIRLGFSFLDGMHLFEFLLRDFMNTEANSEAGGVIAMHDCVPFNERMLTRDLDNLPRGPWTGDVWKLIPILRKYRPEVKLTVLSCRPTGLVLVSNLSPGNTVLNEAYDEIIANWRDVNLVDYGVARFYEAFELTDPAEFAEADYPVFAKVRRDPAAVAAPVKVTK